MYTLPPLPKPYRTGNLHGMPIVKVLLKPPVKSLIDLMNKFRGCYIGIVNPGVAWLFVDHQPMIKVQSNMLDDLKLILADDIKGYHDITEYRLTADRYKQILTYYL